MFKFINFVGSAVFTYYLVYSAHYLNLAFENKEGIEAVVYHGIELIFWTILLSTLYIATFGGSEIYVTTKIEE